MAYFKKYNKSKGCEEIYIDYRNEHGKRIRENTQSNSMTFAKELLLDRLNEAAKRKKLPERYVPPVKFSEFVDNEYLPIHAKGHKTEREYKRIGGNLKAHFGNEFLHKIDRRMVEEYKKGLLGKFADNTINNELNMLSGVFTKAIEWGKASINPVKGIKRFKIKERTRILERSEQDSLINAAGEEIKAPYLQAMVIFTLNTGLRIPSELLNIKWTDIDFENEILHIRADIAKYEKSRYIDLNGHALSILMVLPHFGEYVFCNRNGEPYKRIDRSFNSAVKRAGLKDV